MPFRRAIPRDAPALARLQIESYRTAYAHLLPRSYLDRLSQAEEEQDWRNLVISNPEDVLCIAQTSTGDITGFALGRAGPAEIAPYDGELVSMHVQGRYQRQGIGRELLALVARALAEQGCTSLMLWVLAGNPAQRFYERLGGVLIGEHTIPLGNEVTAAEVAYGWPRIADLYQET